VAIKFDSGRQPGAGGGGAGKEKGLLGLWVSVKGNEQETEASGKQ